MNFNNVFLYIFIYSVIGWLCEVVFCKIVHGNWSNRGFLSGPYCPIYGFGAMFILLLLQPFAANPILIFVFSILITTTLEYITSFAMEKIFSIKWWDYSDEPFNINGRICLKTAILFGILGIILIYFLHPYITKFINLIPNFLVNYIIGGLISLIILDLTTTLSVLFNLKNKLEDLKILKEKIATFGKDKAKNSELIKQLEDIKSSIVEKTNILHNRIITAFPKIEFKKYNIQFNELKENLKLKKNNKKKKQKIDKK